MDGGGARPPGITAARLSRRRGGQWGRGAPARSSPRRLECVWRLAAGATPWSADPVAEVARPCLEVVGGFLALCLLMMSLSGRRCHHPGGVWSRDGAGEDFVDGTMDADVRCISVYCSSPLEREFPAYLHTCTCTIYVAFGP
jgi:hypothetical protein